MRLLLTLVLDAVLLAGMFLISVVVVNATDASLEPKLQALLDKPVEIPAEALNGAKFLAAIGDAPADLTGEGHGEPLKVQGFDVKSADDKTGEKTKDRYCAKTAYYCDELAYRAQADKIKGLLASNRVLLERFEQLLNFPGYGSEFASGTKESSRTAVDAEEIGESGVARAADLAKVESETRGLELLKLARLKLLALTSQIHEGGKEGALREIERMNRFFSLSLKYPARETEAMSQLQALKEVREFFLAAAKEHADLLAFVSSDLRESFKPSVGFEEFALGRIRAEVMIAHERLFAPSASREELGSKQAASKLPGWARSMLSTLPVSNLLLRKNETLNQTYALLEARLHDPCVAGDRECAEESANSKGWSPLRNPIGRSLVQAMEDEGANAPSTYQRAHRAFEEFAEAI